MKKVLTFVAVVALTASSAFAGDISTSRAARLGLAGMQPMSHSQGAQIRGMGFAVVFGGGRASVSSTQSANAYAAGSFRNSNSFAAGGNLSFAVKNGSYAVSGGGSVAYAR